MSKSNIGLAATIAATSKWQQFYPTTLEALLVPLRRKVILIKRSQESEIRWNVETLNLDRNVGGANAFRSCSRMELIMNRIRTLTGGFFCILFLISPALADESQEFLREALRGDNSEIMLGQLAAEQGRSPAVRAFGRILVDDHKKARDEVLGVEPRFSFPESQRISREAREKHFNLLAARGREFDRQFIDYMADVHQRKLDKFGDEAEKHHGQSSLLARRLLPTLQKHLIMAQSLQRREERPYEGWETQRRMGGPGKGWYYR